MDNLLLSILPLESSKCGLDLFLRFSSEEMHFLSNSSSLVSLFLKVRMEG